MQKELPNIYHFINEINLTDLSKLSNNINLIYRNYEKKISLKELLLLKKICNFSNRKLFISNDIKLALEVKLNGIYIPSYNKKINYISRFSLPKKFDIIGSAHNQQEIQIKKKQGCKKIFLSPMFKIKKKKNFLEIYNFNKLALDKKIKFIALGGINETNYKRLKLTKADSIAAISWIKKNGLSKLRPF